MTDTAQVATPVAAEVPDMTKLRVADRCDAHPMAQAAVRVAMPSALQLLFCGHCYAHHEAALAIKGAIVLEDIRATLK